MCVTLGTVRWLLAMLSLTVLKIVFNDAFN